MSGLRSGFPNAANALKKAFAVPASLSKLLSELPQKPSVGTPEQEFSQSILAFKDDGPDAFAAGKKLEKLFADFSAEDPTRTHYPNANPANYAKPIEVDWAWFSQRIRSPGVVDKYKKLWDNFAEPEAFTDGASEWAEWCAEMEIKLLEAKELAKTSELRMKELQTEMAKVDTEIAGLRDRKLEDEIALSPEYNAKLEEEIDNNIWNPEDTEENYNDPLRFPDHPATKAALAHAAAHGHH